MASAQCIIADIATLFPLPTASETLQQRYVVLKKTSKKLQNFEIKNAELIESTASKTIACQLLAKRLQFLTTLIQTLKTNNWNAVKASYRLSAVKTKVKNEISKLESQIDTQNAVIEKLQTSIRVENLSLKKHNLKISNFAEASIQTQEHLALVDNHAKHLREAYTADERVIQDMQQYYFKLMISLFQLQRELDKLQIKVNGTSEMNDFSKLALLKGWHKMNHILKNLSQQQQKFLSQQTDLYKPVQFTEFEINWIKQEIQLQKTRQSLLEHTIDKLFDVRKTIGDAFITEIGKTEDLLQEYVQIESNNMAINLKNARLTVLGQVLKLESDLPMYQRYQENIVATTDKSNCEAAFNALYERKKQRTEKLFTKAEAAAANLHQLKVKVRSSIAHINTSEFFEFNSHEITDFKLNIIDKMSIQTAKELLRSLMLKNDVNIENKNTSPLPDDIMAGRLMEASNKYSNRRHHMFEEHLMAALNTLKADNNKVFSEIADLENKISAIEQSINDEKKNNIDKKKKLCEKLRQRIIEAEAVLEAKLVKKESAEAEQEAQWKLKMEKLKTAYFETLGAREKLKAEKLRMEALIRQAKINENNLRYRYNVFVGLKKEKLNEKAVKKKLKDKVEHTKKFDETLKAEVNELSSLLTLAQQQQAKLANKFQRITIQKTSSVARKTLETYKNELEAEVTHLEALLNKIN